ncbi:Kcnd2 [Symbiodinium necroappetens]|uniref:Kcnd2 protein n=1 Tax=Symbiodinium necroappetens TaxID=1628268 RepID=A0A812V0R2_9DINO|nr:Kcnd2 [Symbiodinium necroappetens]
MRNRNQKVLNPEPRILWSDADTPEGLVPVQIRPADCDDFGYLKHAAGFSLLEQAVVQWSSADARYLTWPVKDYWFHVSLSGRDSSRSLWAEVTRSGDLLSLSSCEFRVSFYSTFRSNSTETPVARGSIRYGQENSEKVLESPGHSQFGQGLNSLKLDVQPHRQTSAPAYLQACNCPSHKSFLHSSEKRWS